MLTEKASSNFKIQATPKELIKNQFRYKKSLLHKRITGYFIIECHPSGSSNSQWFFATQEKTCCNTKNIHTALKFSQEINMK